MAGSGSTRRSTIDHGAPATPSSRQTRSGPVVVRAFFAHHQGMSLVALANVLCDDAFVKRFHADPRVQATELLLQERVPREAILSEPRPADSRTAASTIPVFASRRFKSPHTASPHSQFLSNGRYTARVTHAGGGSSTWQNLAVTRRRDDRTSDAGAPLHLPARSVVGSGLVRHLPAVLPGAGRVRSHRSTSTR